jgi:P pilus assembly chaperone PapD
MPTRTTLITAKHTLISFCIVLGLMIYAGAATASLMVAPIRVVFGDRTRSASVLILNTDKKPHTYRMGWKITKMKTDGSYEDLPDDANNPFSVSKMVVVSPKQITIQPDGRQNIRLSVRKPANLPPGEYRGHLVLETVPENEMRETQNENNSQKGISFGFRVAFGLSIPVIIRHQSTDFPDLKIDNIRFIPNDNPNTSGPRLAFDLLRKGGELSPYGRIDVYLDSAEGSPRIGQKNNVAIFKDISKREMWIDLTRDVPPGSKIRIVYLGGEEYSGQNLATKYFETK